MNKTFTPPDQQARDTIRTALDQNLLVEAAAGTGKTTSMVGRMVALIRTGTCQRVSEIAAITFTRKATAELRARFQIELEKTAFGANGEQGERLLRALSEVEQCSIGTIHSFCARLLRERPVEAGVDPDFEEMEEEDSEKLAKDAWEEYCTALFEAENPILDELREKGLALEYLEPGFNRYVTYPDVDEWAIPKSEEPDVDDDRMRRELKRYLYEIGELLPRLPIDAGKDPLIPRLRAAHRKAVNYELDDAAEMLEVLYAFDFRPQRVTQYIWKEGEGLTGDDAKAALDRWNDFRDRLVTPYFAFVAERNYPLVLEVYAQAMEIFDRIRHERNLLNFQDLLLKSAALLRDNPTVRTYFSTRYTRLMVDEFHDTDPVQAQMVLFLTAVDPNETDWRKCVPRPGSLFVVGDPKQSIYRFRRADIETYNEVKGIIAAHGQVVEMTTNFRSEKPIIDWVNEVFGPSLEPDEDKDGVMQRFGNAASRYSPAYVPLEVGRPIPAVGSFAGVQALLVPKPEEDENAMLLEAEAIAKVIRVALDSKETPYHPEDFLIVPRNTTFLNMYGEALQRLGIPHVITGGGNLNEVEELRLLLLLLKALSRPDNPISLVAALRSRLFGLSDRALYAHKKHGGRFHYYSGVSDDVPQPYRDQLVAAFEKLQEYASWLERMPPVAAFRNVALESGVLCHTAVEGSPEYQAGALLKALELLRPTAGTEWSVNALVKRLEAIANSDEKHDGLSVQPDTGSYVRVMNLHKVKGLEARVVFLACLKGENSFGADDYIDRKGEKTLGYLHLTRDLSKHKSAIVAQPPGWTEFSGYEDEFDRAEQLRLRYVAATRAREAMIISVGPGKDKQNPWQYFVPYLNLENPLPIPAEASPPISKQVYLDVEAARMSWEQLRNRRAAMAIPGYTESKATGLVYHEPFKVSDTEDSDEPIEEKEADGAGGTEGEVANVGGAQWGIVIHKLLELKMEGILGDAKATAGKVLEEQGLAASLTEKALVVLEKVEGTKIWQRAAVSKHIMTEVPFEIHHEADGKPGLLRGVIDLVFKEEDEWVIVDYKTDSTRKRSVEELSNHYRPQLAVYRKAFEMATRAKVKEVGLLFAGIGEYSLLGAQISGGWKGNP